MLGDTALGLLPCLLSDLLNPAACAQPLVSAGSTSSKASGAALEEHRGLMSGVAVGVQQLCVQYCWCPPGLCNGTVLWESPRVWMNRRLLAHPKGASQAAPFLHAPFDKIPYGVI